MDPVARGLAASALSLTSGAARLAGRLPAIFGNSIAGGTGTTNAIRGFASTSLRLAGSLHNSFGNRIIDSHPGFTTTQFAPFIGSVLAQRPSYVVIEGGTNDANGVTDVPTTLAAYQTAMLSIMSACKRAGVPIIVCTVPPMDTSVASVIKRRCIGAMNYWLKLVGPQYGLVADVHAVLVDPTNGNFQTQYSSGDVHPNEAGHLAWARVVQTQIRALQGARSSLVFSITDANLAANPLMAGGSGATLPTGYAEVSGGTGTAPAYSTLADASSFLPAGSWLQMDFDATAAGGTRRVTTNLGSNWAVGDLLAVTGHVQVVDVSGDFQANAAFTGHTAQVISYLTDQSSVALSQDDLSVGNVDASGNYNIGPFMNVVTVPAATTGLKHFFSVTVPTGSHYKARLGALGVFNLTRLGLTAPGLN